MCACCVQARGVKNKYQKKGGVVEAVEVIDELM
jgi:hypothetical protein